MIPLAFSTSLFVESSHGEALKKNTLKALSVGGRLEKSTVEGEVDLNVAFPHWILE